VRLCDALGVAKPIVLGQSFGGFVAQRYIARHPGHAAKVILSSTAPRMNLEEYAAACGRLGTTDLSRHTDAEISAWLDELMVGGAGTLHVLERTFNQTWWRGRLCDSAEGFSGLHECIYRPAGSIHDYGRAHMRHGESVFYASWNLPTVIRELAPVPGQFVQIIAVRP
jgi:pimeloyl-ACP methyl ester carboxylesterase